MALDKHWITGSVFKNVWLQHFVTRCDKKMSTCAMKNSSGSCAFAFSRLRKVSLKKKYWVEFDICRCAEAGTTCCGCNCTGRGADPSRDITSMDRWLYETKMFSGHIVEHLGKVEKKKVGLFPCQLANM